MPAAAVVINRKGLQPGQLEDIVGAAERRFGWEPSRWFETTIDDPGRQAAAKALATDPDVLIVVGGDGTVRAVAEEAYRTRVPISIVPTGTGNLVARNLRLPLSDLDRSVSSAFDGVDRTIDIVAADLSHPDGTKSEMIFVAMAGIGLDAAMAVNSDGRLKSLLGWVAYVPPIARSILSNRSFTFDVRVGQRSRRPMQAHTMIVGNCGVLTGDIVLMPAATVDDGLLDLVVLRPGRLIGWTPIGVRLVGNGVVHRRRLRRGARARGLPSSRTAFHAQAIDIDARFDEPQLFELDGDIVDHVTRARFELLPGSLRIRVPG